MRGQLYERVIGTIVSRLLYDSKKVVQMAGSLWSPNRKFSGSLATACPSCPTFLQRERKSFILYMSYTEDMKLQFFRTFDTNFTEDDESIDFLDDEVSRSSASTPKSNYVYVSNILILSDFYNPRSILRNKRRNRARENRRRMKTWL